MTAVCSKCKKEIDHAIACTTINCGKVFCKSCAGIRTIADVEAFRCEACIFSSKRMPRNSNIERPITPAAPIKTAVSVTTDVQATELSLEEQTAQLKLQMEEKLEEQKKQMDIEFQKQVAEEIQQQFADAKKKIEEDEAKKENELKLRLETESKESLAKKLLESEKTIEKMRQEQEERNRKELERHRKELDEQRESLLAQSKIQIEEALKASDSFALNQGASTPTTQTTSTVDLFTEGIVKALRIMKEESSASAHTHSFEQADTESQIRLSMIRAALPQLPKFNGTRNEWPLFEKIFNSTTEEGQFSDNHNKLRLMTALEGEARAECQSLLSGMAGGAAIMAHLKEVYGDAEKILTEQVEKLLRLRDPKDLAKHLLKGFVTQLEAFVLNAIELERKEFLAQPSVIKRLVEKLRDRHQDGWQTIKESNPEANLNDLLKYLKLRLKDASAQPPSESSRYREARRVNAHDEDHSSFQACVKCDDMHSVENCPEFREMKSFERRTFARAKGMCYCCLKQGHRIKDCPAKRMCNLDKCKEFHHRALHRRRPTRETPINPHSEGENEENSEESANIHQWQTSKVLYKILPVMLHGVDGQTVKTFAFLDDGSSATLMDQSLYERLGLRGRTMPLCLKWTGGVTRKEDSSKIVDVEISKAEGGKRFKLHCVRTVKKLELSSQSLNPAELQARYPHLRGVPLPNYENAQPRLLIGLKNVSFLASVTSRFGGEDDPIAVKTKLGWTVFGAPEASMEVCQVHDIIEEEEQVLVIEQEESSDESLHNMVKTYFSIEAMSTAHEPQLSKEDQKALEQIEKSMTFKDGRYEAGFLWKNDEMTLPNSYPMAKKRLESLERTLAKNEELKRWTCDKFKELVSKGYARIATDDDLNGKWKRTWYLPTFTVVNENKIPLKPRQVYDAAAKCKGKSLNSELMSGPDLLVPLQAGLYKFRENLICVTADVTEMYNQIKLNLEDQQCQRLLWRDCEAKRKPDVYIFSSLSFGPTCAPAIAQAVKNIHAAKFKNEYPEAVRALIERTYMDDYFNSHENVEEAVRVSVDAIKIMKAAGFELGKFRSNSKQFLKAMPANAIPMSTSDIEIDTEDSITKVLGLYWDTKEDCFTYRLHKEHLEQELATHDTLPTKRQVLRLIMKIFDFLGLIAHFTIRGRMLLQEIWRDGTQWDAPIKSSLLTGWKELIRQLKGIESLKIPRQYAPINIREARSQLHIQTDASEKAYAAAAFIRIECGTQVYVALVSAKSKVMPTKQISIPKGELMGMHLGAHLGVTVEKLHDIKFESLTYWSDSKCALTWLKSDSLRLKQFVAHRVSEILDLTTREQWRYVPSKLNVADDATKMNETEIKSDSRWFTGPEFLRKPAAEWPQENVELTEEALVAHQSEIYDEPEEMDVIAAIRSNIKSSWKSTVRVIAYMLRWRHLKDVPKKQRSALTPAELQHAEIAIFRKIQSESFPADYVNLRNNKPIERESKIKSFAPFMDEKEGVIRLRGRLDHSTLSYAAQNPVILPNKHTLVDLMIEDIHQSQLHQGEETQIAVIRRKAWVISIRSAVRRVKKNCQRCKNNAAEPSQPRMGQIPKYRMEIGEKPFTHVGIDCFGPIETYVRKLKSKRWGMIFVCMVSRAVHVELVESLDTENCLLAITTFLAIRGPSTTFYSDNGTNFRGAAEVLRVQWAHLNEELGAKVTDQHGIQWLFQPPWTPHFGGPFERMVQAIKRAMHAMLKGSPRLLTDPVLRATVSQAIALVNSRPLTHSPISPDEEMPLTPNDLLGQSNLTTLPNAVADNDKIKFECRRMYQRAQHLADVFAKKWIDEYLPVLTRRCKWFADVKKIEKGDVVLIVNSSKPRDAWKKGRVSEVYPGRDGEVRVVDVVTAQGTIKRRSVVTLAVLDVMRRDDMSFPTSPDVENGVENVAEQTVNRDSNILPS